MAEVIDMSAGNLDRHRSPSGGDECPSNPLPPPPPGPPPRKRDREEPNPNPRSSSPSLHPPPPPNSRPDRFLRDRDRDRDRERDRDRDRDRDIYRRRSPSHSPSPPPYSHRERRRSPPLRRASPTYSPPPYYNKRSRRDDGGFDRRRGSPREDRRFGYEFGGGRGGFGDDRPHGRFNRNSDWSDAGFGGYGDAPIASQREGLMTYKQFIQVLEDDILPAEAERRYQEYRNEYITTQKRAYFELHKEEDWLKEKYHPTNLVSVIEKCQINLQGNPCIPEITPEEILSTLFTKRAPFHRRRRNEQAKSLAKELLSDLQNGTLDIGPEKVPTKQAEESDANSDESDSGGKRRRRIKAKDKDLSSAPRAHPISSEQHRIQLDIDRSQSLARKLDSEKGIEGNILADLDKSEGGPMGPIIIIRGPSTVKGLEGIELLDTLLTYLWRVHGIDYYGMKESHEAKGLRHIRGDAKAGSGSDESGSDWVKRLDSYWKERINGQDPLVVLSAKDKIEAVSGEVLDPLTRKIRDDKYGWKYGCGAKGCTKLFHAPEFVHKHLKLKHPELVIELTAKMREEIYHQNYMNDPNAPGGTPVMQQPAPDRMRRRPPLANRLRDERGGPRREEDRGNKRRAEGSPTREGDEAEAKNGDDPMFDAFGGRGPRGGGAPFLAEFPPPPILMPVPGAGPLGPFVPAPPEVAMRMMREQGGGPAPFDTSNGGPPAIGGGGVGGRKAGMLGVPPGIGGSAPLIAIPPAFQHDPRRIRSYRDLDAPEDEVTVLDYRSL